LDFDDGVSMGLGFGPSNGILHDLMAVSETVKNYSGQTVYASGTLKAVGTFQTGFPAPGNLGPSDGVALSRWLGEIALIPGPCRPADLADKSVTVHFFVPLTGAVGTFPQNGAFLGSYHTDMTFYSDSTTTNVLNTLSELTLSHTFTAQESVDVAASGLFLRLYVLGDAPVALYIDRIVWQ
jgi:hypothetical protein